MKRRDARGALRRLWALLRARFGGIAYYGGVALALTLLAVAAEHYRGERAPASEPPSLPAVELSPTPETEAEADAPRAPEGALLRAYEADPVWSEALGLWESHVGVDYRLTGDVVTNLCAGTVRAVRTGGALGGCVEVESGDLLLRYASIVPRADLEPGRELEAGEPLGEAGANLPGEAALGPHLHLEAERDGRSVDFAALVDGD